MNMTRRRWVVLIISAAVVLGLTVRWWIAAENDRRLDGHARQTLERYERAFAKDGARATLPPPQRNGHDPFPDIVFVEKVIVRPDGKTLTAEFTGGKPTGPCGADYSARAVESEHAALIVVEEHSHRWGGGVCTAEGHTRQATVRLSRPLAGRTVLEAWGGVPVPVDFAK